MVTDKVGSANNASGADATGKASAGVASTGGAKLDYDAFLKLLIAQMQNQDPLEPQKSSDYVAQLATFSQVEKSVQTNERISELLSSARLQQAEALIGRTATSEDGQINGVVVAAKVAGNDVVAVLSDGRELTIRPGVIISKGVGA